MLCGLRSRVDQPRIVRGGEPAAGGEQRRKHLGASRMRAEPAIQIGAVDQLHRDVVAVAIGADLVHGQHVRVLEPGHRARLAEQPGPQRGDAIHRAQHLDRHRALEIRIERGPHHAHAAGAEHAIEPVLADRSARSELGGRRAHRTGFGPCRRIDFHRFAA